MTERNKQLQQRIEKHVTNCIKFVNRLPFSTSNKPISTQLIRSVTSIGANYEEACEAESAKDFVHKIKISKKEAKETLYWLRIVANTNNGLASEIALLTQETDEFVKIFSSIVSKFK